ncbi:MAG TPA: metalloregulator ArsR/SmtB family transcription factor [bacterium]|nr:metalloregulator ArsR/SmtB family transcription factor [bacterium]
MRKKNADRLDYALAFKALSNENRLKVFQIIRKGHVHSADCCYPNRPDDTPEESVCVCEILEKVDISAPTLSHHLKELRYAGLVDVLNRGQWSYYTVSRGVLENLADFFAEVEPAVKR